MGFMKLMLLLLLLFNFTFPSSFAHLASNMYSDESNGFGSSGDSIVVNQSKFARASARGKGGGGRSAGESNNGNRGQSNSSPRRGGGAVIPVYAAGAGATAKPNNHHSAANICSRCRKHRILIVVATILTSLLLHICM